SFNCLITCYCRNTMNIYKILTSCKCCSSNSIVDARVTINPHIFLSHHFTPHQKILRHLQKLAKTLLDTHSKQNSYWLLDQSYSLYLQQSYHKKIHPLLLYSHLSAGIQRVLASLNT